MDPKDLTSFDRLITPQYVQVLFWIGVATSVLAGVGLMISDLFPVTLGLAVLLAGPILTRVGCELLVLAFKLVDWVNEIKTVFAKQQEELTAKPSPAHHQGDSSSASPGEASSSDTTASPTSSHTEG